MTDDNIQTSELEFWNTKEGVILLASRESSLAAHHATPRPSPSGRSGVTVTRYTVRICLIGTPSLLFPFPSSFHHPTFFFFSSSMAVVILVSTSFRRTGLDQWSLSLVTCHLSHVSSLGLITVFSSWLPPWNALLEARCLVLDELIGWTFLSQIDACGACMIMISAQKGELRG